ncbi:MAG: chitobiase/beta-hexosaminidase C-terminal domain-containing protein, partial [Syntrophaceae bacterium]|nr:chitobiase/beta-hexosaminidase C-terminal domain-containing protein [Syntrophaceae bacterium]
DKAGNKESIKTESYVIQPPPPKDTIPPVTKAAPDGKTFVNQVRVTLVCKDNTGGSGCKETYYTTDGAVPTTNSTVYRGPATISETTTLNFFSIDKAGNKEAVKTEKYVITKKEDDGEIAKNCKPEEITFNGDHDGLILIPSGKTNVSIKFEPVPNPSCKDPIDYVWEIDGKGTEGQGVTRDFGEGSYTVKVKTCKNGKCSGWTTKNFTVKKQKSDMLGLYVSAISGKWDDPCSITYTIAGVDDPLIVTNLKIGTMKEVATSKERGYLQALLQKYSIYYDDEPNPPYKKERCHKETVEITSFRCEADPDPVFEGDRVKINCFVTTDKPAKQITFEFDGGKNVRMGMDKEKADGKHWEQRYLNGYRSGTFTAKATPISEDGVTGKEVETSINVKRLVCKPIVKFVRSQWDFPHKYILRPASTDASLSPKHIIEFEEKECKNKRSESTWWVTRNGKTTTENPSHFGSIDGLKAGKHSVALQVCVGEDCSNKVTADFEVIPRTYWAMEKVTYGDPEWKFSFEVQEVEAGKKPDTYVTSSYILIGYGPGTKEEVQAFIEEKPKGRHNWNLNAWANYKGKKGAFSGFTETDHDHIAGLSGKKIEELHKKQSPDNYIRW